MEDFLEELQQTFFGEAEQILDDLEDALMNLEKAGFNEEDINTVFRLTHNFKGSSRSVGFVDLADLAHKCEDLLSALKSGKVELRSEMISSLLRAADALRQGLAALNDDRGATCDFATLCSELSCFLAPESMKVESSPIPEDQGFGFFEEERKIENDIPVRSSSGISSEKNSPINSGQKKRPSSSEDTQLRVSNKKLDKLVNLVGELVVNQTIIHRLSELGEADSPQAGQIISYLTKTVSDIQSVSMSLRLVPLKPLFQKLRRAARDVANEIKKEVVFVEDGEHVELDKTVVDRIIDPLTHMIRNAVDHGIEDKDERLAAGKPPEASVTLSAISSDDRVIISVKDDGRGMDRSKILAKAIANRLVTATESEKMNNSEVFALIFQPGFSTKEQVTGISGRGVGMEVVLKAVEELKGSIDIESELGKGSTFTISLPLSLSIIGGMIVNVCGRSYIVPVSQLIETIELSQFSMETSTGSGEMIQLRDEVLPIYHLGKALRKPAHCFATKAEENTKRPALITSCGGRKVGFEVDAILGQQQVVLKKLGKEFNGLPGLLGGAILSTGDPGLVLNLYDLIKQGGFHAA